MIGLILVCSILLCFVIGLNLWQSITMVLFSTCVYLTGRRMENGL